MESATAPVAKISVMFVMKTLFRTDMRRMLSRAECEWGVPNFKACSEDPDFWFPLPPGELASGAGYHRLLLPLSRFPNNELNILPCRITLSFFVFFVLLFRESVRWYTLLIAKFPVCSLKTRMVNIWKSCINYYLLDKIKENKVWVWPGPGLLSIP